MNVSREETDDPETVNRYLSPEAFLTAQLASTMGTSFPKSACPTYSVGEVS